MTEAASKPKRAPRKTPAKKPTAKPVAKRLEIGNVIEPDWEILLPDTVERDVASG